MRYHRKEYWAVEAQQYDGSFDLDFLRPDEHLTAGEPDGATVLIHRDAPTAGDGFTVEIAKGEWAVRLRDGHITTLDHESFTDEYMPVDDTDTLQRALGDLCGRLWRLSPEQRAIVLGDLVLTTGQKGGPDA